MSDTRTRSTSKKKSTASAPTKSKEKQMERKTASAPGKMGSKEKSKSKTSSSETKKKAFDVMFEHTITKDDYDNKLIKAIHQLSTVDKSLHTKIQRAKENTNDLYNTKTNMMLSTKYKDFTDQIKRRLRLKEIHYKDVDENFREAAQRLRTISPYFHFATDVREDVIRALTIQTGTRPSVIPVSHEIARRWRAMSEDEKDPWIQKAANEKRRLEEFKTLIDKLVH